jgi:hypothetical protein
MVPVQVSQWYARVIFFFQSGFPNKNGQVCAMVSLLTGKCVPPTTAMTGEVRVSAALSCEVF